jgi:hypothetical protein
VLLSLLLSVAVLRSVNVGKITLVNISERHISGSTPPSVDSGLAVSRSGESAT